MKLKFVILFISLLVILNGCQTIKKKSNEASEKENNRLSQYIGKQSSELKTDMGIPSEDFINEVGNETLVYKSKKYGISCERKFEVNSKGIIIGFSSSGCL